MKRTIFLILLWARLCTDIANGQKFPLRRIRSIGGIEHMDATVGAPLLRRISRSAQYSDGIGEMREGPNAREISNKVFAQVGLKDNTHQHSDMVWAWGQFLDHDISLSHSNPNNGANHIKVRDKGDLLFPKIKYSRSDFVIGANSGQREQINSITAFIDASNVYGSTKEVAESLREMQNGRMKMVEHQRGDMLPIEKGRGMFMAGDERVNEHLGLTSMHTLFVREHNRLAALVQQEYPEANDEDIYQLVRKIVSAELQIITYKEFLPAVLGVHAPSLDNYAGPVEGVSPGIANEFSTAAFRFGHTMLSPELHRVGGLGDEHEPIPLMDSFFSPSKIQQNPVIVDQIIHGFCVKPAQSIDTKIIDDVRNFLFEGVPSVTGLDLVSLNIQRGRDHGLPTYNNVRSAYSLPRKNSFAEVTSDPQLQNVLADIYGQPDKMDVWVGGLAEDHMSGASIGELFVAIIKDQFERLRDGDEFFYLNDPDLKDVSNIIDLDNLSLSTVIKANTSAQNIQNNVFVCPPTN
ncbi:hypothetical protein ACA910_002671 [Epithemia clementina (nom. ined.)]